MLTKCPSCDHDSLVEVTVPDEDGSQEVRCQNPGCRLEAIYSPPEFDLI